MTRRGRMERVTGVNGRPASTRTGVYGLQVRCMPLRHPPVMEWFVNITLPSPASMGGPCYWRRVRGATPWSLRSLHKTLHILLACNDAARYYRRALTQSVPELELRTPRGPPGATQSVLQIGRLWAAAMQAVSCGR